MFYLISLISVQNSGNRFNESVKEVQIIENFFKEEGILLQGITIGQVIDAIDILYSDPRLKTVGYSRNNAFCKRKIIQGWTGRDLDQAISHKIKLVRCEQENPQPVEGCATIRKARNAFLENIKKIKSGHGLGSDWGR